MCNYAYISLVPYPTMVTDLDENDEFLTSRVRKCEALYQYLQGSLTSQGLHSIYPLSMLNPTLMTLVNKTHSKNTLKLIQPFNIETISINIY